MSEYESGASIITSGGFVEVYPIPGFVIAILTIFPLLTAAVPIYWMLGVPVDKVVTPTLTLVCIPDLYPEPLFPILIAEIVPAIETVTVAPAETSGWYPNPSVDPTDTIIPPLGRVETFTSYETDDAVPVKVILVIPKFSDKV